MLPRPPPPLLVFTHRNLRHPDCCGFNSTSRANMLKATSVEEGGNATGPVPAPGDQSQSSLRRSALLAVHKPRNPAAVMFSPLDWSPGSSRITCSPGLEAHEGDNCARTGLVIAFMVQRALLWLTQ